MMMMEGQREQPEEGKAASVALLLHEASMLTRSWERD